MTVYYHDFFKTQDHSYNLARALVHCKKVGANRLVFDKGSYIFSPTLATYENLKISNHDVSGDTSVAALIKEMQDFTLDGNGSEFICNGVMVFSAILSSKNITLCNFTLSVIDDMRSEALVTDTDETGFSFTFINKNADHYIKDGVLHFVDGYGHDDPFHYMMILSPNGERGYSNESYESFYKELHFEYRGQGNYHVSYPKINPPVGMKVLMAPCIRHGCGIFADHSTDLLLENITVHSAYGMGGLAQLCENITVHNMTVIPQEGQNHSTSNDALHFVSCKGKVEITNSHFEGMLDDALNVHGLFYRVVDQDEHGILVCDMHPGTKGIPVFFKGAKIAISNSDTLIRYGYYTITDIHEINPEYIYLTLDRTPEGITVGDVAEEVDQHPKIIFQRNTVRHNRARGVLLASSKKTVISENHFNTPGISVFVESDGKKWFESGGTTDITIENNLFDNCGFAKSWGTAVIEVRSPKKFDGEHYYQKKISIINNKFQSCSRRLFSIANTEYVEITENQIQQCTGDADVFVNCKYLYKNE